MPPRIELHSPLPATAPVRVATPPVRTELPLKTPVVPDLLLPPGNRYWHGQAQAEAPGEAERHLWIRLTFVPGRKVEVNLWWARLARSPDVKLVFGLYGGAVELGSLVGNGFDAPGLHRLGFGTLAVNLAVQALQDCCSPQTLVQGVLSNTAEEGLPVAERERLEGNRRAFWRRFGLEVMSRGEPSLDYLHGCVADLRQVSSGTVAGCFPRTISLRDFTADAPQGL